MYRLLAHHDKIVTSFTPVDHPRRTTIHIKPHTALITIVSITLTTALTSACTSTPVIDCDVTDWRQQGERDAARGRSFLLEDYLAQCANQPLQPDGEAYATGYEAGLQVYCTPRKGLLVGKAGLKYANTCPPDTAPAFLSAHRLGSEIRRTEIALRQADLEASRLSQRLQSLNSDHPDRGRVSQMLSYARNKKSRLDGQLIRLQIRERQITQLPR